MSDKPSNGQHVCIRGCGRFTYNLGMICKPCLDGKLPPVPGSRTSNHKSKYAHLNDGQKCNGGIRVLRDSGGLK